MRHITLFCVLWLMPALAAAQYTTPTVVAIDAADAEGRIHVVIEFTGTGVPAVRRSYYPDSGLRLRTDVDRDMDTLNRRVTGLSALKIGALIPTPPTTPPPAPLTPLERFRVLANRYRMLYDVLVVTGLKTGLEAEFVALKNQVLAAYDPAFLQIY